MGGTQVVTLAVIVSLLSPAIVDSALLNNEFVSLNETFQVILGIQNYFKSNHLHFVRPVASRRDWCKQAAEFFSRELTYTTCSDVHDVRHRRRSDIHVIYVLGSVHDVAVLLNNSRDASTKRGVVFLPATAELEEYFLDVHVPYNVELLMAQRGRWGWNLHEVYRVAARLPVRVARFGSWGRRAGFQGPRVTGMYRRRSDLEGIVFRTTNLPLGALTVVGQSRGGGVAIGGFHGTMWALLERCMNFSSEHRVEADGSWGNRRADGSWDGMVGAILAGEVDVGFSGIIMTPERAERLRYIAPHVTSYAHVFIRKPRRDTSVTYLLSPLSLSLWLTLAGSVVVLAVAALVFHRGREDSSLVQHLFHTFGAVFCQQALDSSPMPRVGGRIVIIIVYVIGITAASGYSAFLMSSLTVERPRMPFNSLAGLEREGSYSLGTGRSTAFFAALREATSGPMRELYERVVAPHPENSPLTPEEGMQILCERRRLAFIFTDEVLWSLAKKCDLVTLREEFQKIFVSCAFSHDNPYAEAFDLNLLRLKSSGIVRKLYADATVRTYPSPREGNGPQAIGFSTVLPVVTVWVVGVVTSVALLLLEALIFNLCHNEA